jgi:hypothetical protein
MENRLTVRHIGVSNLFFKFCRIFTMPVRWCDTRVQKTRDCVRALHLQQAAGQQAEARLTRR